MPNEIRVVTDLDGVIAHSQLPIIEAFNQRFGTDFTYSNWTSFDLLTRKAIELSQESSAAVAAWLYSAQVMMKSEAVPGTNAALAALTSIGASCQIVTSRPSAQASVTRQWVQENIPGIESVHIRTGNGKPRSMTGNEFKLDMIQVLQANVYLEDDPSVISALLAHISQGMLSHLKQVILVDRPWNDTEIFPTTVARVGNWRKDDFGWNEIVEIVQALAIAS